MILRRAIQRAFTLQLRRITHNNFT